MEEIRIDRIVRSRRRTIALIVTSDSELLVRAPLRVSRAYIDKVVRKKSAWIRKKLLEISKRPKAEAKRYSEGEEFWYLGARYRLCIVKEAREDIVLADRLYISEKVISRAGEAIKEWYKAEALKVITARIGRYIAMTDYRPLSIRITDAKRRWGSCGRKGTLNFSWRTIMAPPAVIDYLLVHELVHIRYLDHSKRFWHRVGEIMPNYKKQEEWLKEHERLLLI